MTMQQTDTLKTGDWVRLCRNRGDKISPEGTQGMKAGTYLHIFAVSGYLCMGCLTYACNNERGWDFIDRKDVEVI